MKWIDSPAALREQAERYRNLDYPGELRGAVLAFASELDALAAHLEAELWGVDGGCWPAADPESGQSHSAC